MPLDPDVMPPTREEIVAVTASLWTTREIEEAVARLVAERAVAAMEELMDSAAAGDFNDAESDAARNALWDAWRAFAEGR